MKYIRYRLVRQCLLNLVVFSKCLMMDMVGVSLLDLRAQMGLTYEQIARALAAKAAAQFVGAIFAGMLHEVFLCQTDLLTALSLLCAALAHALIPWVFSLSWFCVIMIVLGFTTSIYNTGCDTATLNGWEEKSAPMMQLLHVSSGIGSLVTIQLTKPFLNMHLVDHSHQNQSLHVDSVISGDILLNATQSTTLSFVENSLGEVEEEAGPLSGYGLEIPFTTSAGFAFLTGLALTGLFIKGPPSGFPRRKPVRNLKLLLSPASCSSRNDSSSRGEGGALLVLCVFYTIFAIGAERMILSYIFSYAVEADVAFSKTSAADLATVFCGAFITGRLLAVFLTHVFPVQWVLLAEILCGLVTMAVGAGMAFGHATVLWMVAGFSGLFTSAIMPGGMAWINMYLKSNSMLVMLFVFGASAGNLIYQYIPGYLFDKYGVVCLMYIQVQNSVSLLLVFSIMLVVARKHGPRCKEEDNTTSGIHDGTGTKDKDHVLLDEICEKPLECDV